MERKSATKSRKRHTLVSPKKSRTKKTRKLGMEEPTFIYAKPRQKVADIKSILSQSTLDRIFRISIKYGRQDSP